MPHPRPLSEPTVTDRREVMERGVITVTCKKRSNEKQNTIKREERPLLLFLSSLSSNPQLWGKRLLEDKVLFFPKLFQRCMGNLSRKGV